MSRLEYSQDIKNLTYKEVRKTFNCKESTLEIYHCRQCDFKTDLLTFLKKHIAEIHRSENCEDTKSVKYTLQNFICKYCTFETHSSLQWLKHQVAYPSNEETRTHKLNHHLALKEIKCYQCVQCPFKTKHKYSLECHKIRHKPDDQVNWLKCDHCEFKSKFKQILNHHVRLKHTEWKDKDLFHCDKCPFKTKEKVILKTHNIRRHLASEEIQWFQCDKCPFKAKTKNNLTAHITYKHSEKTPELFYCDKCPFKTKHKQVVKKHNISKHLASEEIHWFHCDECPYKAKFKRYITFHKTRKHCASNENSEVFNK